MSTNIILNAHLWLRGMSLYKYFHVGKKSCLNASTCIVIVRYIVIDTHLQLHPYEIGEVDVRIAGPGLCRRLDLTVSVYD